MPADEREIAALERPSGHELPEPLVRLLAARDHQQPGRVAIEAVNDSGAVFVPACGLAREPVDERAARMPCARVDDDARRLVHDEEMLVLVGDAELDVLLLDPRLRLRRKLDVELLPALEPVALRPRTAVHLDVPALEQLLGRRARANLGQLGEEAVEPRARGLLGDANPGRREPGAAAAGCAAEGVAPQAGPSRRGR